MVVLFAVNSMHRLAIQKKGHPVGPTLRLYLGDSSTAIQEKPPKPPFPKKAYLSEGRENTGTAWEKTPAVKRSRFFGLNKKVVLGYFVDYHNRPVPLVPNHQNWWGCTGVLV